MSREFVLLPIFTATMYLWSALHCVSGSRLSWVAYFKNNKEAHTKRGKNRKHGPLTSQNESQTDPDAPQPFQHQSWWGY